jgi:hypothetical protein
MHSDLLERCQTARAQIEVPQFPLASIRAAADRAIARPPHQRSIAVAIVASLSLVALAAAAEIAQQTHVHFTPSGGFVISSDAGMTWRSIHSSAQILAAARRLDFPAVLPQGLPDGTKPTSLFTSGANMLYITYNLPGAQRRSHHWLSIFIADHATMMGSNASVAKRYQLNLRDSIGFWRMGPEEVVIASNGLTQPELATIKRSMLQAAKGSAR